MSPAPTARLEVLRDPAALADRAADWMLAAALAAGGGFAVALSGGTTPKALYERLATPFFIARFPWDRTHWFWGDERFVPHDDPLSNARMARDALLARAPVPAANIHQIPTEGLAPEEAAAAYEEELRRFYGTADLDPARPLFDVTLLGLGEDGHTASLFPGTAVLDERRRWAAAVIGAKAEPRITLTYPALGSSRRLAFLVSGRDKREIFARLRAGDETLPAARVRPVGETFWFADGAAAGGNIP